jgi:hypothetical protein
MPRDFHIAVRILGLAAIAFITGYIAGSARVSLVPIVIPRPQATPAVKTPCEGLMLKRAPDGMAVIRAHYTADPEWPNWLPKEIAKYKDQATWDLEMEIMYQAKSGALVFPEFNPSLHVIPHDRIPRDLCRFMAIDPHPRTPHAMLWLGIDRWNDWYLYRELWPSVYYGRWIMATDTVEENFFHVKDYAETITKLEGNRLEFRDLQGSKERAVYRRLNEGERIIYRFMDYAGKGFRASAEHEVEESLADRYDQYGIKCNNPYKGIEAGNDAIRTLLASRKHEIHGDWPKLHISARLLETKIELSKHRYPRLKVQTDEKELKQEGVEARRHMIDLLRYLAMSGLRYSPNLVSQEHRG